MSDKSEPFNPFDPAGMFKTMRDSTMDAWSKMMIDLVHTDAYAAATGKLLDAWLGSSIPFRKSLEGALAHALSSLSMPLRNDVISLAERLTNIEMRLDDLEALLEKTNARPHGEKTP